MIRRIELVKGIPVSSGRIFRSGGVVALDKKPAALRQRWETSCPRRHNPPMRRWKMGQESLSRGIRCECLNVRRFKRGGEAAKHAPVYVARDWLTLLSNCLTLARGDEGRIFIIHGVSSASNRFILL